VVEASDDGRREEEQHIGNGAQTEVGIKGRVEISLCGTLEADQSLPEAGIHKAVGNGKEYRHHGNQPVIGRYKEPGQKQGDKRTDAASGDLLREIPDNADGGFFS